MKKTIVTLLVLIMNVGINENLHAQDAEFTQFYANPLYLNPAFAGSARCPRICLNYRNQWPGLNKTYIAYNFSYDQHFDGISGGLGVLVTNDRAGDGTMNTTDAGLIYSYAFHPTPEFSIRVGFQGTFHQKIVDWSKVNFGDMIDPKKGFIWNTNEIPKSYPTQKVQAADFSAGILGFSKRYFFGLSAHHLTQPDESFTNTLVSKLPIKITGHAGAMLPIKRNKGNDAFISPNILFQKQQEFQQLNIGLYFMKGSMVTGLWYRNMDALILLLGYQMGSVRLGYSYDVTVSRLANSTLGSHEISLNMQFDCKPAKKKYRLVSCPSF